ncbi:hypothetical protein BJV82DRAFT_653000 [Fennellomyces sp. T-0311]|nr:hypothetical protein BJV82DRAFT_653000 [Fennellomyces sp. T-0311]
MNNLPGDLLHGTLDWELEHKKAMWLDPTFTTNNFFQACKGTLCGLINREEYEEAIELYDQIVSTGIYDISGCWKTGLMLAKKTGKDPAAYLEAAHRVCRDKHKITIFLAYMDVLMEMGQTDKVEDNINVVWISVHGNDSDVKDIQSFLKGVKSTENWIHYLKTRCENVPRKSQYTPLWLPSDKIIVREYLEMLRARDPGALVQAATTVLRRAGQESELDLMRIALEYYTPPLAHFVEWLDLMVPYNQLDPIADPNIFANPFFFACMNQYEYWDPRKPETFIEYGYIYDLLKGRLEAAKYDQWVIDKLSWLCASILNMKKFRQQFTYANLIHADQLGQIVESKIADLQQEEQSTIKALKKSSGRNEKELMRVVGDFYMKISTMKELHALLNSVHHITSN